MRWILSCVFALAACGDDSSTGGSGGSGGGGAGGGGDGGSQPNQGGGGAPNTGGSGPTDGGGTSDGGGTPNGSPGCGVPLTEATEQWLAKTADLNGTTREFFVWLPPGYDPLRAYPVVYQFHGCNNDPARENNNVPVQDQSGGDAIHVRGRAVDACWDTNPTGPDVAFYDAMVDAVETGYCADPTHRFATGYSSGSFMTHLLSCVRGSTLRGVASIAGGMGGSGCTGNVAALLIHDANDNTVNISASEQARDRYLTENACGETTTAFDPAPCQAYEGCSAGLPVVWCQTAGQDHSRQDGLAAPAFWNFLSTL